MKPALILAAIAGGASGIFTATVFNAGLVSTPAPGSIFAYIAMTPRGGFVGVLSAVLVAAVVSFLVASVIIRATADTDEEDEESLGMAAAQMETMKGSKSSVAGTLTEDRKTEDGKTEDGETEGEATPEFGQVKSIVFACDAGMGSSAMGASLLRNKVKKAGIEDVSVTNASISNLSEDTDLVVTHKDLTDRARAKVPNAIHVSVDNFLGSPKYDEVVTELKESREAQLQE
jgi:mannitol PTS system EIICBA or EIICB component